MHQEIGVNTNTLASQVDSLRAELERVRSDIDGMYEAVQTLDTMWDGPANDAFRTQFTTDKEAMEELCKTVQSIIDSMDNAKKEYDSCEMNVSQIISAIQI